MENFYRSLLVLKRRLSPEVFEVMLGTQCIAEEMLGDALRTMEPSIALMVIDTMQDEEFGHRLKEEADSCHEFGITMKGFAATLDNLASNEEEQSAKNGLLHENLTILKGVIPAKEFEHFLERGWVSYGTWKSLKTRFTVLPGMIDTPLKEFNAVVELAKKATAEQLAFANRYFRIKDTPSESPDYVSGPDEQPVCANVVDDEDVDQLKQEEPDA